MPRFGGENGTHNRTLVSASAALAEARGIPAAQLAMAYVRAKATTQGITLVPTLGSRTRAQLADALGAPQIALSADDIAAVEAAAPAAAVAGTRYAEPLMKHLDSER